MSSKSLSPSSAPAPMLRVAEIEGKGRSLVASAALRAGEIVLRDSPLLLYSAFPFYPTSESHLQSNNVYCSNCFRLIISQPPPSSCPACSDAFCSSACQSVALSSSHSPWLCQSLRRLRDASYSPLVGQTIDRQVMARFLVAAYNLAALSPSDFGVLLSLQGDPSAVSRDDAVFLHSLISSLCPPPSAPEFGLSVELTASLLAKDKLNGFGLMEPFHPDKDRSVRAYGIYPRASFFNHDCLPNACRFDYVDADANSRTNTDFIVRILHDVPEGREICLSYFPVNLKYSERQRRLKEDYGFTCDCDRCKVEANWDDEEGEMSGNESAMSDGEEAMEEDGDQEMEADSEGDNGEFPHAYFFLRFMCSRDNCWGTLAPLPPSNASPSTLMECNVCGNVNSAEEPMDDGSGNQ